MTTAPLMWIDNRYQVYSVLGKGGMGTVYQAIDRLTDNTVALKHVTNAPQQSQFASETNTNIAALALAREFRTLASLRHPNIVSVLDYGFDQHHFPYFTMELITDARTILVAGETLSLQDKTRLLIELLQALVYLHRRQVLHRDIKPANILVTSENKVKVLDFGLSTKFAQTTELSGTLRYMSPEGLRNQPLDHRTDLFAVGVLGYELLSGQYPFDLRSGGRLVSSILVGKPDSSVIPNAKLAQVILTCMAKSPVDRYRTAGEVIDALSAAIDLQMPSESVAIRESFLQTAPFIGRSAEFEQLSTALNHAILGDGSSWLIGGESGVGKSRLMDEIRTHALVKGAIVLRGQAVEESGQPYQVWRSALRRAALMVELDDLSAATIKPLVPDVQMLLNRDIPEVQQLSGQQAQRRLISIIATIFRELALTRPLVLLLDDMQWTVESLEPLHVLNRAVADYPMLIIASYRTEERPDLPQQLPDMQLLALSRLTATQIADLSVSMLGDGGRQPEILELLQKETEGNTLFLVETVRALAEEAGGLNEIGHMPLPPTVLTGNVQRLLQRRLAQIPDTHMPLLKRVALAGRAIDMTVLDAMRTFDTPLIDAQQWLVDCADVAILEVNEGHWRFSHDKLREELLAGLLQTERPMLHYQVAQAFEQVYANDATYAATMADHWEAAHAHHKALHYLRIAADFAANQYANEEAVRFLSRALALNVADDDGRYEMLLRREHVYHLLGNRPSQRVDLDALLTLATTLPQKIDIMLRFVRYYDEITDLDAVIDVSERAKTLAIEANDLVSQAAAIIEQAHAYWHKGDKAQAERYLNEGLELAYATEDEHTVAIALLRLGSLSNSLGQREKAGKCFTEALSIARAIGAETEVCIALANLASLSSYLGQLDEAQKYYEKALKVAQTIGDRSREGTLLNNMGVLHDDQGLYEQAEAYFQQALQIYIETDGQGGQSSAYNNLGGIATIQRDYAKAKQYLQKSYDMFDQIGNRYGRAITLEGLGTVARHCGNYAKAMELFQKSLAISQAINEPQAEAYLLSSCGHIYLLWQQYAEAANHFRRGLEVARSISHALTEAKALRLLGTLALEQHNFDEAKHFYQQAVVLHEELNQPHFSAEDLAGLAFANLKSNDLETALACAKRLLKLWKQNPTLRGASTPMQALYFLWQVCDALQLPEASDVVAAASEIITDFLRDFPNPDEQAMYLQQPHHRAMWALRGQA